MMAWPRWLDEEGGMVSMEASSSRTATLTFSPPRAAMAGTDAARATFARTFTLDADSSSAL
ncbi:hypothetical protein OG568_54410 (plasmid) [Streptomyces sp. NBC_01450]|uniref:hypothetical protein n=1 Tax=Streptomyces sp. NBC_01450 TaxID=2903871 RepID=UPI002E3237A2|nr:hypothetical protein [Streptomyces sp. NBC_01450]